MPVFRLTESRDGLLSDRVLEFKHLGRAVAAFNAVVGPVVSDLGAAVFLGEVCPQDPDQESILMAKYRNQDSIKIGAVPPSHGDAGAAARLRPLRSLSARALVP